MPARKVEIRQTCLVNCRNLGRRRQSDLVRNSIDLDAPRTKMRQGTRRKIEHQVESTGDQVLNLLRVAAIEDELILRARGFLKESSGNMPGATLARRSLQRLVRVCFQPGDQLFQVICRQTLLRYDQ